MKTFQNLFFLIAVVGLFSCNKEPDFNYPPGTVGSSKIIYFPSVQTIGERTIYLKQDDPYTDEGANAILNGAPIDYTTNITVNTSVPGVYDIEYSATNAEGYTATDWRTVVVIGNDVANNDFSGTYLRPGFATSTWTKTGNGIYTVENPGGATTGVGLTVVAVNYTDDQIAIPHQISADFGEVSSADEEYNASDNPVTYYWAFFASGYGTQIREFIKQ